MLARIRKALVAGGGAGLAAAGGVVAKAPAFTRDVFGQALGAFLIAAAVTGWATWRVENAKAPLATGGVIRPRP